MRFPAAAASPMQTIFAAFAQYVHQLHSVVEFGVHVSGFFSLKPRLLGEIEMFRCDSSLASFGEDSRNVHCRATGSTQPSCFNKLKPTIGASYKLSAETSMLWRTPDGPPPT